MCEWKSELSGKKRLFFPGKTRLCFSSLLMLSFVVGKNYACADVLKKNPLNPLSNLSLNRNPQLGIC